MTSTAGAWTLFRTISGRHSHSLDSCGGADCSRGIEHQLALPRSATPRHATSATRHASHHTSATPPPPSANDCTELKMGLIKRCMENCCECQSKMEQYNLVIDDCVIPGGQTIIPGGDGRLGTQQMASTCGTAGVRDSCPSGQSCNAGSGWKCQCNSGMCAAPHICTPQGACIFQCAAGTEPYSIGSTTCVNCEGNKYSPLGQTCETCAPGREPNADHTACQPCHDKGAQAWFSSDGGRCQMCSPGSEVDAGRTQCTVCTLPQQFSAHGLSCIPCANEGVATAGHTACVLGTTRPPPPPQQIGTFSGGGGRIEYVTENAVGKVDVYENNGLAGYTTYRLSLQLQRDAKNVYTIYGDTTSGSNHPMSFPPAYQVAAPFGANIGGVADQLIAVHADATYDSWLTVGVTGGNNAGAGKRGNMSSTPRAVMSDGMMGGQDSSSSGQCRRHRHNIHRQNRDARRAEQLLQPPRAAGDVPSYVDGRGGTPIHSLTSRTACNPQLLTFSVSSLTAHV